MPKWSFLFLVMLAPGLISCQSTPAYQAGLSRVTVYMLPTQPQVTATDPLNKRIDVDFEGTQIDDAIKQVALATGENMNADWTALLLVGIEKDLPIDLQLIDIPAWKVLDAIIHQATAIAGDLDPVGWARRDGVITISTVRVLQRYTVLAVYDVRHLITPVPCCVDFSPVERTKKSQPDDNIFGESPANDLPGPCFPTPETSDMINTFLIAVIDAFETAEKPEPNIFHCIVNSSEGTESIFSMRSDIEEGITREDLVEQLATLIKETVGTIDEWGAQESTLHEFNGWLIIKTTPEQHAEIRALLSVLPSPECH